MSINWVMLSPDGMFIKLPQERIVFKSPPRTSLAITTPSAFPGSKPFSLDAASGVIILTNQRVVYLPASLTSGVSSFKSFSCPITNLHDTHVIAPFFGANYWTAVVQPVTGGGFPDTISSAIQLKLTFKEGGAFDYHGSFEQIRERLVLAREEAQTSGNGSMTINYSGVHTDELPAYDHATSSNSHAQSQPLTHLASREDHHSDTSQYNQVIPSDLPPGYDEAQSGSFEQRY